MEKAIRVEGLTKRFGAFTAVDNVTFSVKSGEIFGILGPNGAGKTTTLEIIEGLQDPSEGSVSVPPFVTTNLVLPKWPGGLVIDASEERSMLDVSMPGGSRSTEGSPTLNAVLPLAGLEML